MKITSTKRILALLMVLALLFSFVGCKKNTSADGSSEYEIEYEYVYEDESGAPVDGSNDGDNTSTGTSSGKNPDKKNPGKDSSGNTSGGGNTSDGGKDPTIDTKGWKGTITLGVSGNEAPEMKYILSTFNKSYPDIKVKVVEIASSLYDITPKWTSLAAAGNLPDVVIGSENFGYIMQQGWAYPLDNLVASDSAKQDILEVGLDRYRYGGKLYALPFRIQFNSIIVNKDLLNTINEPAPSYNWNVSTFKALAKKATTEKTSGLNYIYNDGEPTYGVDNKLLSSYMTDGFEQYGYNLKTKQFALNTNNAFVASQNDIKELKSVPALVSDDLKYTSSAGGISDYEARFGKGADAFVSGKVLFGNHNTWELDWFTNTLKYNADMYPVPTADNVALRVQTHVDFVFMNSKINSQGKASAAFALCRYLSFDKDGCNLRIDYNNNHSNKPSNNGKYTFYAPTTTNKEVLANYKDEKLIPGGVKFMLETVVNNPKQSLVADCNKVVPDFWQNVDQYRKDVQEKINGGQDPAGLWQPLQDKINAAMKSTNAYLDKKVKENQDKFYKDHPYEKR